jgi:hypothetical protein
MTMPSPMRLLLAAALGVCAALLGSCGSSGTGLIPAADAGPLQSDFEAVALAAQTGNGSCTATEAALSKTERDFLALPSTVDPGLHTRLSEGIANLRARARAQCLQQTPSLTSTSTTPRTTHTTTPAPSTTTTQTTPTSTATTPTTTTPGQSGGTAPGNEGSSESPRGGNGKGGQEGNTGAGGGSGGKGAKGGGGP